MIRLSRPTSDRSLAGWLGRTVSYVGTLAELSHEQLCELICSHGGTYLSYTQAARPALLIVGDGGLPLAGNGQPLPLLAGRVISECDLFAELGRPCEPHLYTAAMLGELLEVASSRLIAWARAGLIEPKRVKKGVMWFDFAQAARARTLINLTQAGVSTATIRRSLQRLAERLPNLHQPLQQLAVLESSLLVRLDDGDWSDPDGQLQLNFEPGEHPGDPIQLHPLPLPRSAGSWHEQAIAQEQAGLLADAERSYREAIRLAGASAEPQLHFDLAAVLAAQGKRHEAIERYRVVTDLSPDRADAWNNLGILLSDAHQPEAALEAFTRAVQLDPHDPAARYNLADAADQLSRPQLAAEHWRRFLRLSPGLLAHSRFAAQRLSAAGG